MCSVKVRCVYYYPFYRWEQPGSERVNELLEITQSVRGGGTPGAQVYVVTQFLFRPSQYSSFLPPRHTVRTGNTYSRHTHHTASICSYFCFICRDWLVSFLPFFFHFVCTEPSLQPAGSVVEAHGFSCPVACEILVPPPGIKLVSPALEGRFLTAGSPGMSRLQLLILTSPSSQCVSVTQM